MDPATAIYRRRRALALFILPLLLAGCRAADLLSPPGQPADGPGGASYPHAAVETLRFGKGNDEYWLFLPDEPRPDEAPLVVFLHGWGAVKPRSYGAWIRHVVRKGHIVVYPRYQENLRVPAVAMPGYAGEAARAAWARLNEVGPVRPSPSGVAWVGHSLGGLLSVMVSSRSEELGLPPPAVIMSVEPGGTLPVPSLAAIPAETLVLIVLGDADDIVDDTTAREIMAGLSHLPAANCNLVLIHSDQRTTPPLEATHQAPLAFVPGFPPPTPTVVDGVVGGTDEGLAIGDLFPLHGPQRQHPDTLDFYGFWKLLDGLLDASFRGTNRDYALGDTPPQRFMGRLSDGTVVVPIEVLDVP